MGSNPTPEVGPSAPLRVIVADDHVLVRSGLVALLSELDGIEVVAQCGDGEALLRGCVALEPDLAIVDISMPRCSGLQALHRLRECAPAVRVLILSMYDSAEFVREALAGGACGYLLKDLATAELHLAIDAVREGHTWLSPRISSRLVEQLRGEQAGPSASPPPAALTERQREVLLRLAQGRSAKQIAYEMGVSVKTVEAHRATLMDRLGIRELAGLVRYAARHGLISIDDQG